VYCLPGSIERYFGICFPLQSRVRGRRRVAVYLVPTLLFSLAFNFPKFLEIDWIWQLSNNPFYNKVSKYQREARLLSVVTGPSQI
jgi:hypothetical protein